MAAKALSPAEAELVNSLTEDDIPTKLRCAICSKLAVNAFKLPCCEQLIDENCHATLPSTCPVCEHTPLSATDCNPNKVMRSTIRVFIKTELKKREISRAKQAKEATPVASVTPIAPITPVVSATSVDVLAGDQSQSNVTDGVAAIVVGDTQGTGASSFTSVTVDNAPAQAEDSQMQESGHTGAKQENAPESQVDGGGINIDKGVRNEDSSAGAGAGDNTVTENVEALGDDAATATQPDGTQAIAEYSAEQSPVTGGGEVAADASEQDDAVLGQSNPMTASSANGNGLYLNTGNGLGGDVSQMQMMMAMQNGMIPNGFNMPIMGMPGMNMDSSMQGMYMNSGFQGMGMNGQNIIGGGFGGAGGGPGSSNWNGQQSWNSGQDNFNHPNASSMGNGDYGSYNSGFQTGYNPNFGYQNQFNNYRGFGRGRGRGRGFYNNGYGRGGYYNNNGFGNGGSVYGPNGINSNFQDQGFGPQQRMNTLGNGNSEHGFGQTNGSGLDANGNQGNSEMIVDTNDEVKNVPHGDDIAVGEGGNPMSGDGPVASAQNEASAEALEASAPIPVLEPQGPNLFHQYGDRPTHFGPQQQLGMGVIPPSVPFNQRGTNGVPLRAPVPSSDVPLNAPSGPKAMRQGLPNTSLLHLRARGLITDTSRENINGLVNGSGHNSPVTEHNGHGRSRSNSVSTKQRDHDRYRERGRDHSHDHDYDRSHDHNSRNDRHRDDRNSNNNYKRDMTADHSHGQGQDQDVAMADEKVAASNQSLDIERRDDWDDDFQAADDDAGKRDWDGHHDDDGDDGDRGRDGRGRSKSRSSQGRKRPHSEEVAALGQNGREDDTTGGAPPRRNNNRSGRKRRRRGDKPTQQPEEGGNVGRTRSMSPLDESRQLNGHRSRRERDTDKRRDHDHRDRERDREHDDDHRRRSRKDDGRDRDRDHRVHRDYDREDRNRDRDGDRNNRDKDRRDKDRSGRNRDRGRDRDRDRNHGRGGRDKEHDRSSSKKAGNGKEPASSSGGAVQAHGTNDANDASGGSSDPYAAERERRTRERVAAEAQKRAGFSSLAGTKRGRDDFDDGNGGSGGGSARRSRRRGRRGDGEAEREGNR